MRRHHDRHDTAATAAVARDTDPLAAARYAPRATGRGGDVDRQRRPGAARDRNGRAVILTLGGASAAIRDAADAAVQIHDVDLAGIVFAERRDAERGVEKQALLAA